MPNRITRITAAICRAAEAAGFHVNLYNLDILYPDDDINPPRERIREKLSRIVARLDPTTTDEALVLQHMM